MFRMLVVVSLTAIGMLSCELVEQTAYVPEDASEATSNWLVNFSHTNTEYVDQAKSAYAYAADGELCKASWKFEDIIADELERDGSRMPVAAYNAGVLYVVASWDDVICWRKTGNYSGPTHHLKYALEHMPDRSLDPHIHMLLGNSYWNRWIKFNDYERLHLRSQVRAVKEKAIEHYCEAWTLEPFYRDQVEERFQEEKWSPCPHTPGDDDANRTDG